MSNIEQFVSITGADNETAKTFLEMSGGDVETAISLFFENSGSLPAPSVAPQQQPTIPQGPRRLGSGGHSEPIPLSSTAPAPAAAAAAGGKSKAPAPKSKFASLTDFKEDDDEEGKDNRYYAGGSKNSGQQIIGGDDSKEDDLTSKIFKSAQDRGAQQVEDPKQKPAERWTGSGNRLGSQPSETKPTVPGVTPQLKKPTPQQEQEDEKTITLTFYEDGFTIDNGDLRRLDDPKNKAFLEAIHAGYVPREISGGAKNVAVNLIKHPGKYVPPPKTFKAFEGSGNALGVTNQGSSSGSSTHTTAKATPVAATQPQASPAPVKVAEPPVDLGKPHTTIQIRLADGSRLVAKFNLDDTVKSVYKYASQATPGKKFVLMTTFPRKEFTDESQTITAAGLNNAALSQILK